MTTITERRAELHLQTSARVSRSDADRAGAALRELVNRSREPVSSVHVTLSVLDDPTSPRPALAQAVAEVSGRRVRAQAAGTDVAAAVALLRDRLALRLGRAEAPVTADQ